MARLKVLPTIVFGLLMALALGAALPSPAGAVPAQILPMLPLAGVGLASGTFLGLFAHPAVPAVAFLLSGGAAYLISRDVIMAVWTLAFALPVLVLRRMMANKQAATPTVLAGAAACAAVWLPGVYFALVRAWGMWSPAAMLDRVVADIIDSLVAVEIPTVGGDVLGYTAEQAAQIAQLGTMLLPGLAIFLSCAMAWIGWSLTRWLYRLHGLGGQLDDRMDRLVVSRIGAAVFLVAAVCSLFGGEEMTALEALALNLTLVLEPPLVLVGLRAIVAFFRGRESIGGVPLALVLILLVSCNISVLLLIVALLGVVRAFRE